MILAVAVLLFQFPVAGAAANTAQTANTQAVTETQAAAPIVAAASVPSTASGKASVPDDSAKLALGTVTKASDFAASSTASLHLPPPAFRPPDEAPITHRKSWILLSAVEHSSAGFDAWSTRYALSNGRVEADPLMRPFASSDRIYGAIQAIPIGLDYVARRFQRSSGWTHHIWWAPQAIASATFLFSGSYNVAHTNTN